MRSTKILLGALVLVGTGACNDMPESTGPILFEGAKLIIGDSSPTIEDSAFIVESGHFVRVGRRGEIGAPAGATRVDLSGKVVIPAIVDAHAHLGFADVSGMTTAGENYTRENLVDHLERYAYYGIAAVRNLGTDAGDIAFELRREPVEGAALLRLAGRGIAKPNAGPNAPYYRPTAYGVTTQAEARDAVRELAEREVDTVKIWVDDRGGRVDKLGAELYRPIIDEAHAHGLRVVAHVYYLDDAKELVRAGVDGFAHGIRDRDIDDELLALLAERPEVYVIPNLPARGATTEQELAWLAETVPAAEISRMRAALEARSPDQLRNAQEFFDVQARNLLRLHRAGVTIGFGSDAGTSIGWTVHEELADMVAAGLTPADVLRAATSTSAAIMRLDELGTIADGKSADFIVLDADPLEDISNTRRIDAVYLRGRAVDREALRATWQ